jgi:hypothetical protein
MSPTHEGPTISTRSAATGAFTGTPPSAPEREHRRSRQSPLNAAARGTT